MSFDLKDFKLKWQGSWRDRTAYSKNDIVAWKGKSYRCIQDCPIAYTLSQDSLVNTNNYSFDPPRLVQKSFRPDNPKYWQLFLRSTDDIGEWEMWRQYEPGEMCSVGKRIYQCIKRTRRYNTWVVEHDGRDSEYWVMIYESPFGYPDRNKVVSYTNRAPLGWKYNMGRNSFERQTNYTLGVIESNGDFVAHCGNNTTGQMGLGDGQSGNSRQGRSRYAGFTFTDWMTSTDNKNLTATEHTGRMVTPDGKAPKCIQHVSSTNASFWLFNNGEVYASGDNSTYDLGHHIAVTNTTDRYYPNRVSADDTVDWLGENIRSFNQTKIVKIGSSGQGQNSEGNTQFALGEDGSVWIWGRNNQAQFGGGNPSINNSTDTNGGSPYSFAFYSTNVKRPIKIPSSFFNNKRIVDMWVEGCNEPSFHALDEDGWLWFWGQAVHGGGGVGANSHTSEGTYYYYVPRRVEVDWNRYGGMKMLQHWSYSNQSHVGTWVLDGEGYLWYTGYHTNGQVPGLYGVGDNSTRYNSMFRRTDFHLNGDIDEFWCGGDEHKWIYIRQKSTGMLWISDGNYGTYGTRGSRSQNGYWYNSGGIHGIFSHCRGPRYVKWVTGQNEGRGDGSYIYDSPIILDEDGSFWYGNSYNSIFTASGDNDSPSDDSDGYWKMNEQGFEDNSTNRHRKRRGVQPMNSKLTDLHTFGYPTAQNYAYRNWDGKIMFSGYAPNNQTYLYDGMPYRYQATTGSSWGSNNYRSFMKSPPGD